MSAESHQADEQIAAEQKRNRTRRWIIRVTEEEDGQARQHAERAGMGLSAWVRRRSTPVSSRSPVVPTEPLLAAVRAVNRAGNLVNQEMALAHTEGRVLPVLVSLNAKLETAVDLLLEALGRKTP